MGLKSMFQNSWFGVKDEKELNTPKNISKWLDKYGVKNYTINEDLTVDVDGSVDISDNQLKIIPVQFGKVNGYFDCSFNELTSLKGCPYDIEKYLNCSFNEITSLEYATRVVGSFDCSYNKLNSLKHAPVLVFEDFDCSENHLKSIEHAPVEVTGNFDCGYNKLLSLKGCPIKIGGDFDCSYNQLSTLEHSPKEVGGNFFCSDNQLVSLEHAPLMNGVPYFNDTIECSNNKFEDEQAEIKKYEELLYIKDINEFNLDTYGKINPTEEEINEFHLKEYESEQREQEAIERRAEQYYQDQEDKYGLDYDKNRLDVFASVAPHWQLFRDYGEINPEIDINKANGNYDNKDWVMQNENRYIVNLAITEKEHTHAYLSAFEYVSERLRNDKEVVDLYLDDNASNTEFIGEELNNDKEYILEKVKSQIHAGADYLSDSLKTDYDINLEFFKSYGQLDSVHDDLKSNIDFLKLVITDEPNIFFTLNDELRNDNELFNHAKQEYINQPEIKTSEYRPFPFLKDNEYLDNRQYMDNYIKAENLSNTLHSKINQKINNQENSNEEFTNSKKQFEDKVKEMGLMLKSSSEKNTTHKRKMKL
ncbi:hypothetical protein SAMN05192566_0714 [Methylophilus rhizosphaerae]|uniref:Leucine rich repeat-containing protein n=1 Tax=Methylophilus rhizosphaerae TaxID=492660 RepID=A0A1G9A6H5_9PROT|nr:hypothetical protein [Methylophilus rhizosphaerae]SDK22887.1 hypothetical protein SAMN05192566_0714 [Methylophilus rhizosphaerae]